MFFNLFCRLFWVIEIVFLHVRYLSTWSNCTFNTYYYSCLLFENLSAVDCVLCTSYHNNYRQDPSHFKEYIKFSNKRKKLISQTTEIFRETFLEKKCTSHQWLYKIYLVLSKRFWIFWEQVVWTWCYLVPNHKDLTAHLLAHPLLWELLSRHWNTI